MAAHNSWSHIYDEVNKASFGVLIDDLTQKTLNVIPDEVQKTASILDAGAGTGRISIELAKLGYDIVAIDASDGMTQRHRNKVLEHGLDYPVIHSSIHEFNPKKEFDLVVCVHTVSAYLYTNELLDASLRTFHRSLKPRGKILIDLANPVLFQDTVYDDANFKRSVTFNEVAQGHYIYNEETKITVDNEEVFYNDSFNLRAWTRDQFESVFTKNGFVLLKDLSSYFFGSGHYYLLFQRND